MRGKEESAGRKNAREGRKRGKGESAGKEKAREGRKRGKEESAGKNKAWEFSVNLIRLSMPNDKKFLNCSFVM